MTPDQYRREGFQLGIEAAANSRGMWFGFNSSGEPTGEYCTVKAHDPGDMKLYISHDAIRAIDAGKVLAGLRTRCDERDDEGLLPCPFCGGPAEVVEIDEGENAGGSCVCCTTCGASGNVEFGFKENFVSNWNRRVQAPAPDAVARLPEAAKALGAMPEGYCFCRSDRIGDDSKIHEPECANLRSALVAKENEQCQVSTEPVTGATTNGPRGSDAGVPAAVANSHTDSVSRLVEAATAEYFLQPPLQTKEEQMGRRAAVRGMMVRLGNYSKFTSALAAMEARDASEA